MSNDYTPRKEDEAFSLPPVPYLLGLLAEGQRERIESYGHACAEAARAPLAEENARLQSKISELSADLTALVMNGEGGRLALAQENRRLLARIAELGKELEVVKAERETLISKHFGQIAERDRLRAEMEALRRPLTDEEIAFCIFEARKEAGPLLRNGTLSFRIARAVEKAHLDAVGAPWVNPLAAEVEALKLELAAERAASVIEWEPGRSYTAADLLRRVIANATPRKRDMLWPDVMKLCGVGSTVAHYLCRWAGRDPDTGKAIAARKGAALTTSNKGTPSE
jgi:hypothetical protein